MKGAQFFDLEAIADPNTDVSLCLCLHNENGLMLPGVMILVNGRVGGWVTAAPHAPFF